MNIVRLEGCDAGSLLGYLKAFGILGILARDFEPGMRGAWVDGSFELLTEHTREDVASYLTDSYAPTPIINPWNRGAGFDSGSKDKTAGQTLQRVLATTSSRWSSYRLAIRTASHIVEENSEDALDKNTLLAILRERLNDDALRWLDAAVVVGAKDLGFPPLLGSGGNDGRLDFSINFAQRALDVAGESAERSTSLLRLNDALDGTSQMPRLRDAVIGQFAPGINGGANATNDYDGSPLVNPWDFVLLIEGTIAFAGSVTKRFTSSERRATFPFTFQSIAAGFGTSSAEESTRGELWLPQWRGWATYASATALLRSGRLELDLSDRGNGKRRAAASALEAAQAALTSGSASGVERFTRIVIAQRNGLAYTATPVGTITVRGDATIALLSREVGIWINRVQSLAANDALGAFARAALRRYDDAIFSYSRLSEPHRRAQALQSALVALADLDFSMADNPPRSLAPLRPLPFFSPTLLRGLDDDSAEHRIAAALASYGRSSREEGDRLRFDLGRVTMSRGQLAFQPTRVIIRSANILADMGEILTRRVRRVLEGSVKKEVDALASGHGVAAFDYADFLEGRVSLSRLRGLMRAYSLIEPLKKLEARSDFPKGEDFGIPAAFAALKLAIDRYSNEKSGDHVTLDSAIVPLLSARSARALEIVCRRLRNAGFRPRAISEVSLGREDGPRYAAAALIPASTSSHKVFHDLAILQTDK